MHDTPAATTVRLSLHAEWTGTEGLREAIIRIRTVLGRQGWSAEAWEIPDGEPRSRGWVDAFVETDEPPEEDSAVARLSVGGRSELYVDVDDVISWTVTVEVPMDRGRETLAHMARMVRDLTEDQYALSATLYRSGGSEVPCLPDGKVVPSNAYVVFRPAAEIARAFGSVDALREAGFEVEETHSGVLAQRALEYADPAAYFEVVRDGQWHLARVARAGAVFHRSYEPPLADLFAAWKAGTRQLHLVGYVPAQRALEYATYLEPEEHIRGWEIDELRWLLQAGEPSRRRLTSRGASCFPGTSDGRARAAPAVGLEDSRAVPRRRWAAARAERCGGRPGLTSPCRRDRRQGHRSLPLPVELSLARGGKPRRSTRLAATRREARGRLG